MAPYAAIQYVRKKIGYDEFLREYAAGKRMPASDLFEVLSGDRGSRKTISDICGMVCGYQGIYERIENAAAKTGNGMFREYG